MKSLKEQIEVMQEAERGKKIEHRLYDLSDKWSYCDRPMWNWASFDYRVSKEGTPEWYDRDQALNTIVKDIRYRNIPAEKIWKIWCDGVRANEKV